jgi:hypothetical protein
MLYDLTITQFTKMLHNLNHLMDKALTYAETKNFEPEIFVQARLAPDQFPFVRQVQIACDTAKFCAARLTGKDAPAHQDTEKSLGELQARVNQTIAFLKTVSEADLKAAMDRHVTQPRWEGKYLLGGEYAIQHALPNFYFHITTAYAILRHNGVDVGKKDYLGEMPFKK